jgi:hypothetical protein
MITPKALLGNQLMEEIISIRVDTLWKMMGMKTQDLLPSPSEEGATGKLDNKGAIFIPGGLIFQDVDEMPIHYDREAKISPKAFRQNVRDAMQYDNATLLFPDGMAKGINLDSGFFSKAAKRIYTYKRAAFRRKMKIGSNRHFKIHPDDIIHSHCPPYMASPHGSRTRISTCASVGLIDPPLFFAYCEAQFNLSSEEAEGFAQRIDGAMEPVGTNDILLFPPTIVVCHDTRYKENNLTGLTRLLGIGKFGEFATLTFELINPVLVNELKRKEKSFTAEEVFAEYAGHRALCILRIYAPTNPGKRSPRYDLHIVPPDRYLSIDLKQIERDARDRYHLLD